MPTPSPPWLAGRRRLDDRPVGRARAVLDARRAAPVRDGAIADRAVLDARRAAPVRDGAIADHRYVLPLVREVPRRTAGGVHDAAW